MNKKYTAPALEKGLEVIELLSKYPKGLSLTEISNKLSRTNAQLFRMVSVLKELDYVEYTPEGKIYRLSLKLFRLSQTISPTNRLLDLALPQMTILSSQCKHPCYLVCYSEGHGIITAYKASTDNMEQLTYNIGSKLPLINNCAGHVLLSFASYNKRQSMLEAYKAQSNTEIDFQKLRKRIEKVKKQGYEAMESPIFLSGFDIGFPIFSSDEEVIAVLVISTLTYKVPEMNTNLDEIKRNLESTVQQITSKFAGAED
ncbi:IclR family transcriptional regulator [Parashewanella curva]|uniref:IclR family transcriptional regulator n=1 Tax=Parashewanella curva TaxID=2338552 RepID=A0A3L8Q277_9GAMM|nr:IclR family transcriptional regulator [Parashewanella curva]RLV61099.1 IclR family transcriptional regulator [Parashewanella curva]